MSAFDRTRARREILWYVTQFCLTRVYGDDRTYPSLHGFVSSFGGKTAQPGDLVAITSAPVSDWYLSWMRECDGKDRYLLESVETGKLCWWSNVGIEYLERQSVADNPQWRWTDRQFAFDDRWKKVCYKEKDAYITLPVPPRFGDGWQVILGTRTRFGLDDYRPTRTFPDWRKVTKKTMGEFYDECVAAKKAA